jgi:uncharacterized iron-regulated membrane protein
MIDVLLILFAFVFLLALCGLIGLATDRLTRAPEPERKPDPFTSRQFKSDEIAHLVHQIAIHDAIHPISPANYHDSTQNSIEHWVSERTGRRFVMSSKDWFHIARAWYVTRDQDLHNRCESLKQRLALNS